MVKKRVLILTPSSGFGGLVRQVLEDSGAYQPFLFSRPKDAMDLVRKDAVALIIVDAELGDQAPPAFVAELRSHAPQARLLVIPAEEDPIAPRLKEYNADVILPSPFYLPDLVAAVEEFFGPLVEREQPKRFGDTAPYMPAPAHEHIAAPDWLQDVTQAAGYLTRLSLESASQAALITRGGKAWAYAGELPREAADELAAAVAEHESNGNQSDLARFIRLNATKSDYMLYATPLGDDFTLALVFDAQMPFSQMRAQVSELAKALATAPEQAVKKMAAEGKQIFDVRAQADQQPELPKDSTPGPVAPIPAASPSSSNVPLPGSESSGLLYSYILVPRLPKHRLEGDLATKVSEWLPELCLAFAWRLASTSVHSEFVTWTIEIPADTTPESAVRILDKHLSARIFEEFPRLGRENPSGQFWAPGYFILSGNAPSSSQAAAHLQATRKRQGLVR